ncbi:hypothetical protein M404DRAFT_211256 [Pisolithus tinctorius Marx 270]|uniref:Uncharacterized protein n=1 Tax=Pisolithus tinctorius Marx 270 TaxID=870435 RepID=A0A0C3Q079_PISTI|nr:hypothetical protein M404DRAFT_211256 [Pisolithus tinctorius Marx 270]
MDNARSRHYIASSKSTTCIKQQYSWIRNRVYNGKLKICHANSVSLPCRFIDVERGQEEPSGKSWIVSCRRKTYVMKTKYLK